MSSFNGPTCGPLPASGLAFESLNELISTCQAHALDNGYKLVIHSKKPSSQNPSRVVLRCARGRQYKEDKRAESTNPSKKRSGSTQMCRCPVLLAGRLRQDGKWVTEHCQDSRDTNHQEHNHPRNTANAFTSFRTESLNNQQQEIIKLWNTGIRPKDILTDLRKNHNLSVTLQDIMNLLAKHRMEELAGRTPIEWLYDTLRSSTEYWWREKRNKTGQVQSLFLVPRTGIELIQRHPFILKFDCTYKTNRFNMPLFNICGASSTRSAPSLGCCFLSSETKASYAWALRQLCELMQEEQIPLPTCIITDRELALMNALDENPLFGRVPQLLCLWHVNMNVLAKTKKHFPAGTKRNHLLERHPDFKRFLQDWNSLIASPDINCFDNNFQTFQEPYRHPTPAVRYALNTWIIPWKERIVASWVNQVQHFGHRTTSAVESAHANIKAYITSSTGDLKTVFQKLSLYWYNQKKALDLAQAQGLLRRKTTVRNSFFTNLLDQGNITPTCISLLEQELRRVPQAGEPQPGMQCTCSIKCSHGLPCWHQLWMRQHKAEPLRESDIHEYWFWDRFRLKRDDNRRRSQSPVRDPAKISGRGRPKVAQSHRRGEGESSTRRDPSAFEIVEPPTTEPSLLPPRPRASVPSPSSSRQALSSTATGLRRIEDIGDTYESGTEMWRGYQRSVPRLGEGNIPEDAAHEIDVDFEAPYEKEGFVDEEILE